MKRNVTHAREGCRIFLGKTFGAGASALAVQEVVAVQLGLGLELHAAVIAREALDAHDGGQDLERL